MILDLYDMSLLVAVDVCATHDTDALVSAAQTLMAIGVGDHFALHRKLGVLEDAGLVVRNANTRVFSPTDKGRDAFTAAVKLVDRIVATDGGR